MRWSGGARQWLVRWEGYGELDDTWEPIEHLVGCATFIREFESRREEEDKQEKTRALERRQQAKEAAAAEAAARREQAAATREDRLLWGGSGALGVTARSLLHERMMKGVFV